MDEGERTRARCSARSTWTARSRAPRSTREPFQDYLTDVAWGKVWARPGLERRTRSCLTIALLTALGAENELPMHLQAAIRNGVTPEEMREVIIHAGLYAGIPKANAAMKLADEAFSRPGSRSTGHDMQRGPPRPVPSSEPAISTTSMPSSARRWLVSVLRS